MSMSRLWVRISKCSRESLSLNGERITQYTFFSVGRGTGPETLAPVRVAVSTISLAAVSIAEWSYDFRRMRILFCAMVANGWTLLSQVGPVPGVGPAPRVVSPISKNKGGRPQGQATLLLLDDFG